MDAPVATAAGPPAVCPICLDHMWDAHPPACFSGMLLLPFGCTRILPTHLCRRACYTCGARFHAECADLLDVLDPAHTLAPCPLCRAEEGLSPPWTPSTPSEEPPSPRPRTRPPTGAAGARVSHVHFVAPRPAGDPPPTTTTMRVASFDVGARNLAVCVIEDVASEGLRIAEWALVDLVGDEPKSGLMDKCAALGRLVPGMCFLDGCEVVAIEQQPSFNPIMQTLQGALTAALAARGAKVRQVSPRIKDRLFVEPAVMHAARKAMAVRTVGALWPLIEDEEETEEELACGSSRRKSWQAIFAAAPKRDDLADCLLQAVAVGADIGGVWCTHTASVLRGAEAV